MITDDEMIMKMKSLSIKIILVLRLVAVSNLVMYCKD